MFTSEILPIVCRQLIGIYYCLRPHELVTEIYINSIKMLITNYVCVSWLLNMENLRVNLIIEHRGLFVIHALMFNKWWT